MSIPQTITPRQPVSAVLQSLVHEKLAEVEWPGYVHARDQLADRQQALEYSLNKKRIEALRYLRSAGHAYGEKYSKAESRVFTPDFVEQLGKSNSARRMQRNPWLASLLHGVDEDGLAISSMGTNVLPFGPAIDVQDAPMTGRDC